ncbi:MAG: limonene-1,2-epoxide hydrolase [Maribacter sp.]|jgi:limonene-1,2-epoxide hydrolase
MNIIEEFYTAFNELDAEKMVAYYHDDIVFHDPAFGELKGERAKAMWRMLCQSAQNFSLEFSDVKLSGNKGSAHWEADYIFSSTGKSVHNIIDATIELKDGKIIKHTDVFDTHKWASQAMGWKGKLLGGTKFFQKKLQQQTDHMLNKYIAKNNL